MTSDPATRSVLDDLVSTTYEKLRSVAHRIRRAPGSHTTSLIHEAYLRLARNDRLKLNDESHFLLVAASAMRMHLVDQARRATAAKRGGGRSRVSLDEAQAMIVIDHATLLDLDDALNRLASFGRRKATLVELRFFGGCSLEQAALLLGVSVATASRDWDLARTWIYDRLRSESA